MSVSSSNIVSGSRSPSRAFVRVRGDLDRAGVARLRSELAQWRKTGVVELRLDLVGGPRRDPILARMLAWAATQLRGTGGNLIIVGATEQVRAELVAAVAAVQAWPGLHDDRPVPLIFEVGAAE